jgi:hypothetical protein
MHRAQAEARQFTAPIGSRVMLRGVAEHTQGVIKAIASDGGYKVTLHYTLLSKAVSDLSESTVDYSSIVTSSSIVCGTSSGIAQSDVVV